MNIEESFKKFDQPKYYSRVDSTHPLDLWYGLDEHGRMCIELRANFNPRQIKGTDAIEINQYSNKEYKTICFSLKNDKMEGLFYKFCLDLIEKTRSIGNKKDGYSTIVNRYLQWKKMFMNSREAHLLESQIMGLIGEILFFKEKLCEEFGTTRALKSWSGQEMTHKDFSLNDTWYEVKTISKGKDSVRISSLEQLESENNGYLVIYTLEKMSQEYSGISLNQLVLDTLNIFSIESEKDQFIDKITMQGYTYNAYYDGFVYSIKDCYLYYVTQEFPKLTKQTVPIEITKVSYELSLTGISQFKVR